MEQLEVFEEERAHWRWRYTDGNGAAVLSNHTYDEPDQAETAARSAYPDLALVTERDEEASAQSVPTKKDVVALIVAVLVALGIIWWRHRAQDVAEDVS